MIEAMSYCWTISFNSGGKGQGTDVNQTRDWLTAYIKWANDAAGSPMGRRTRQAPHSCLDK
ncbi:hypothetical protein [Amycolatopsis decaplanina]|uniref:Uncharacterized protein n=1 Tax=Amycolatopsis decaplanina DSM 44594 TaxID=1284240 RepID=M2YQU9_9PSEU|nr:hypothetical protein [Amycolatopsis decaplanina]EME64360.1 hypothetical protein H074_03300 [Amycolatopsis decaplanina DSM 44594]